MIKKFLTKSLVVAGALLVAEFTAWGGQAPPSPPPAILSGYATQAQLAAEIATARANEAAVQAAYPLTDYLGIYTLATLPNATTNNGKRVLATDLGGGPGYLRATNGCWKRVSTTTASVQNVTVATSTVVDGLTMSPIINLIGSSFGSKATMTVTNACSIPQLTVVNAAGVFGVLGSLGIALTGGQSITVSGIGTSGSWNDYAVSADGTQLTKIRGGSL